MASCELLLMKSKKILMALDDDMMMTSCEINRLLDDKSCKGTIRNPLNFRRFRMFRS